MPRRPTRSQNSKRPTRKDITRRLDNLDDEGYGEVDKTLTLAELLNYETETVDEEAGIVRLVETGELRRSGGDGEVDLGDRWRQDLEEGMVDDE